MSLSGKDQDNPELLLLDPDTLEILHRLDDSDASGDNLAWSGDGSTLAIPVGLYYGDDQRVRVWSRAPERRSAWKKRYISHRIPAERAGVNEDGSRIAVSWADGTLGIWDRANGSIMTLPGGHPGGVNALLWSKDGTRLYSGGKDGRLRTWDAINSKLLATSADLAPDAWITWKPDKTYVASSGAARFLGRRP